MQFDIFKRKVYLPESVQEKVEATDFHLKLERAISPVGEDGRDNIRYTGPKRPISKLYPTSPRTGRVQIDSAITNMSVGIIGKI
jgi:hypothetical protein